MSLGLSEISNKMGKLKGWSLEINSIQKNFEFKNFKESMDFVNKIAEIAEKKEHHPDILISYNNVRLILKTHSSNSLTEKDFDTAEEIDRLGL